VTESYREEQTRSDIYRVRQYTDEAFVFTGAGYLLSNIQPDRPDGRARTAPPFSGD
jgi:hypothetical protein